MDTPIHIVGGGLAGLIASIACAEAGADVHLVEAHTTLGGRAVTAEGPWKANLGPHAVYTNTGLYQWLRERDLLPAVVPPRLTALRMRWQGERRAMLPGPAWRGLGLFRRLDDAPVDSSFRDWATALAPPAAVEIFANSAGVLTFDHDPGRLSAAFVAERLRRITLRARPVARYVVGGWSVLVDGLAVGARERGVHIETGSRVDALPEGGPVIVATSLRSARRLLDDAGLCWTGTRTVLLDVGLTRSPSREPNLISDLDEAGWAARYSATDPSLAPEGHDLIQCHMGARPGETLDAGVARTERLLDVGFPGWREREVWRRRSLVDSQSGALDEPGTTWRDRPAVDRGDGVFLCGDQVAAPGHLAEVSWGSALSAARLAIAAARGGRGPVSAAGGQSGRG
jgi:phytoene dehydrogenase-like protein